MRVTVAYYHGSLPLEFVTGDARDLPRDRAVWVEVERDGYRHRLGGMDSVWVHGDAFGCFNDPENADWYEGRQRVAWRWTGRGSEEIDPAVPDGATVFAGVMLPDEDARAVGLI
jgi:hypothetical protein